MSHRVRAQLFQGETYQSQMFSTSFNEYDEELQDEIVSAYLKFRTFLRDQFLQKTSKENNQVEGA